MERHPDHARAQAGARIAFERPFSEQPGCFLADGKNYAESELRGLFHKYGVPSHQRRLVFQRAPQRFRGGRGVLTQSLKHSRRPRAHSLGPTLRLRKNLGQQGQRTITKPMLEPVVSVAMKFIAPRMRRSADCASRGAMLRAPDTAAAL